MARLRKCQSSKEKLVQKNSRAKKLFRKSNKNVQKEKPKKLRKKRKRNNNKRRKHLSFHCFSKGIRINFFLNCFKQQIKCLLQEKGFSLQMSQLEQLQRDLRWSRLNALRKIEEDIVSCCFRHQEFRNIFLVWSFLRKRLCRRRIMERIWLSCWWIVV